MRRRLIVPLLLLVSSQLCDGNSPVSIAVGRRTPVIDGAITRFEYSFGGTGFLNLIGKTYSMTQSHYYLSCDDTRLYVGVITPTGDKTVAEHQARDANLWEDDSIEIHLLSDARKGDRRQFIVNVKGVLYDSKGGNADWDLNDVRIASKVRGNQWTLECAFPFRELGPAGTAPDDVWRINICRSFKANPLNTCIAPCNAGYADTANFAEIRFCEGVPAVDIASLGHLNSNVLDVSVGLSGGDGEALLTLSSPRDVLPYHSEKRIRLSPGTVAAATAKTENLPPDNVLNVSLRLADGTELYRASFKYRNQLPLTVSYIYTDADKQILNLVCNSSNQELAQDGLRLSVRMLDEGSQVVMTRELPIVSETAIFTLPVSVADLPPGEYKCVVECVDGNDKVLLSHWERYRKPAENPPWRGTTAGMSDTVSAPWTPVAATPTRFSCWGRTYSFGTSGLLSSIQSQNVELLAGPIRLAINGKNTSETTCALVNATEATAQYRLSSRSRDIKMDARIEAAFDGFLWVDLDLTPLADAAAIDRMTLEIPLNRASIVGFDDCQSIKAKRDLSGDWRETIPSNFAKTPSCWIGGDAVGLMLGARNLKGWHVKDKDRSMELIPGDGTITVRLNLIDTTLTIAAPRTIGLYLEATPARPRNAAVTSFRDYVNVKMWSGYWCNYFDYYNPKYLAWARVKKLRGDQERFRTFHYSSAHGASPYSPEWNYFGREWHSSPPKLGAYCVDSDVSKRELRDRSTFTYACLDCRSFFDYKLATLADAIANPDIGITDLYVDLAWPKMCHNETHGCAWTDAFGDRQGSFDIIGAREYFRRLRNVLKAKNAEAAIVMHIVRTRTPADAFADMLVVGESYDREVAAQESYYDVFSPSLTRIAYASRATEQGIWFIPQFLRGFTLFRPQRAKTWKPEATPEGRRAVRHFLGYMTVHDLSFWWGYDTVKPGRQLYAAQDWLGWDAEVRFFPYWNRRGNPVRTTAPESDRVMVSTFTRAGKALLAVLNDTDAERELSLQVDSATLFGKVGHGVTGKDCFSGDGTIYEIRGGNLKLRMGPRGFKLLMLE